MKGYQFSSAAVVIVSFHVCPRPLPGPRPRPRPRLVRDPASVPLPLNEPFPTSAAAPAAAAAPASPSATALALTSSHPSGRAYVLTAVIGTTLSASPRRTFAAHKRSRNRAWRTCAASAPGGTAMRMPLGWYSILSPRAVVYTALELGEGSEVDVDGWSREFVDVGPQLSSASTAGRARRRIPLVPTMVASSE